VNTCFRKENPPIGAIKNLKTQLFLKLGNLCTQGRLGDIVNFSCFSEMKCFGKPEHKR